MTEGVLDLVRLLDEKPQLRALLESALEREREHEGEDWLGFQWHQVAGGSPAQCNRLVTEGVLRIGYRSRASTEYRLALLPELVREALELSLEVPEPVATEIPQDLFEVVEGHERAKRLLRAAIEAPRPVHVLLSGVPGTAKSLILDELCRLPEASGPWLLGNTSRAGLLGLLRESPCKYVILDEVDKGTAADLSTMLSVMETGLVAELKHGRRTQERRPVWVFAGCNYLRRLPAEFLDRCLKIHFEPYSTAEFRQVVEAVLVRRESCDPELAAEIATALARTKSRSPRDAVRVARLAAGDRRRALELAEEIGGH